MQAQRDYAASLHIQSNPFFFANPRPAALVHSTHGEWQELPLFLLAHKKVMTVSGVAVPALFHRFVREVEAEIIDMDGISRPPCLYRKGLANDYVSQPSV